MIERLIIEELMIEEFKQSAWGIDLRTRINPKDAAHDF